MDSDNLLIVGAPVQPGFDAPRLTRRHGQTFPKGVGNIEAEGRWGYTEDDGTAEGRTPLEIRRACMMLVLSRLPLLGDADAMDDIQSAIWTLARDVDSAMEICDWHCAQRYSSPSCIGPGQGTIVMGQRSMQLLHILQKSGLTPKGKSICRSIPRPTNPRALACHTSPQIRTQRPHRTQFLLRKGYRTSFTPQRAAIS